MDKNVALVLGSGGARGLTQIGVIEELEKRGYNISSISGSSMGAVVGAVYAAGELPKFKDWICNLDRFGVFNLMDFTLTTQGFIKGEKVFNEIKKFVPTRNIEDLKLPFAAVAVDIKTGSEVTFNEGDLFRAVRASVAIPSVLTPIYLENKILIDGGVVNPLPMDKVARRTGDILMAVNLNADGQYAPPAHIKTKRDEELDREESRWKKAINKLFSTNDPTGKSEKKHDYFDILNGSFDIMQNRLTKIALASHNPKVLINVPKSAAKTFAFFRGHELIEFGRQEAKKQLDAFEKDAE